jgi:hypothetical protein
VSQIRRKRDSQACARKALERKDVFSELPIVGGGFPAIVGGANPGFAAGLAKIFEF